MGKGKALEISILYFCITKTNQIKLPLSNFLAFEGLKQLVILVLSLQSKESFFLFALLSLSGELPKWVILLLVPFPFLYRYHRATLLIEKSLHPQMFICLFCTCFYLKNNHGQLECNAMQSIWPSQQ